MEEIREIALAYYNNLSDDDKRLAYQVFRKIDSDGDGTITIEEFVGASGPKASIMRSLFRDLDTNGDGKLDFEEFITFFYMFKAHRTVGCDGTGCNVTFIKGGYFTCVECFNHNKSATYDLCISCYRYRNYVHTHNTFADSHFLLRSMSEYNRASDQSISRGQPSQVNRSESKINAALTTGWKVCAEVITQEVIDAIVNNPDCNIM